MTELQWICQTPILGLGTYRGLCGLPLDAQMVCQAHGDVTHGSRRTVKTLPPAKIWAQVLTERARQDAKWGEQNHPDGTGPRENWGYRELRWYTSNEEAADIIRTATQLAQRYNSPTWRGILMEEVAEVFAAPDTNALRDELIQVIAVAVAWVECLDRRSPAPRDQQ